MARPSRSIWARAIENGRAVTRSFQFGNMVLSKTPILASRNLLLPRRRSYTSLNLQRGALEAMVASPFGPLRVYSVHLDHTSPDERIVQIRFLLERAAGYPLEGGAVTGVAELGFPEPPHPGGLRAARRLQHAARLARIPAMTGLPDDEFGLTPRAGRPADAATLVEGRAQRPRHLDRPEASGRPGAPQVPRLRLRRGEPCAQVQDVWIDHAANGLRSSAGLARTGVTAIA